jgi:hypothetical protein
MYSPKSDISQKGRDLSETMVASAGQSECARWQFVLISQNGHKDHSVQQPEGDERVRTKGWTMI